MYTHLAEIQAVSQINNGHSGDCVLPALAPVFWTFGPPKLGNLALQLVVEEYTCPWPGKRDWATAVYVYLIILTYYALVAAA